jgi:methylenetetrahydrofolate dehydrogenase (NADP+)/methenyltetrahydrofolate cyclohydrolase
MVILDGKKTSEQILKQLHQQLLLSNIKPKLAIILIGDNPSSLQYVSLKQKKAAQVGIQTDLHHFPDIVSTQDIVTLTQTLNRDSLVNGIMVQLPLPPSLDTAQIIAAIDPQKDVDGLTPANLGLLFHGSRQAIVSATPLGVMNLFKHYEIPLSGKNAVILGRSEYIGLPLAALLLAQDATVTICHSHTSDLPSITRQADILLSAIGRARLITGDMVKSGSVVVDIGLSADPVTQQLVGDVDFDSVSVKAGHITPVPGGVGPMTIASLLANVVRVSS